MINLLFLIIIFFFTISSTFAWNLLFQNPTFLDINFSISNSNVLNSFPIRWNNNSASQYCLERWYFFISYSSDDNWINIDTAQYNINQLKRVISWNDRFIDYIICFDNVFLPPPPIWTWSNIIFWWLSLDWIPQVWDEYLFSVNSWKLYLNTTLIYIFIMDFILLFFFIFLFWKFILLVKYLVFWL